MKNNDLPPPVTRDSSKRALWEELKCVREEVGSQQSAINDLNAQIKKNRNELEILRYQARMVRAVMELEVR